MEAFATLHDVICHIAWWHLPHCMMAFATLHDGICHIAWCIAAFATLHAGICHIAWWHLPHCMMTFATLHDWLLSWIPFDSRGGLAEQFQPGPCYTASNPRPGSLVRQREALLDWVAWIVPVRSVCKMTPTHLIIHDLCRRPIRRRVTNSGVRSVWLRLHQGGGL